MANKRTKMNKGYIYNEQIPMFGHKEVIGYGTDEFYVKKIYRKLANKIIMTNHYSKKYFNNSFIHLGVFIKSELIGVLQFGHLLNNLSASNIVEGSKSGNFIELNRMWLDDKAKRNSESKAISYSIKYINSKFPKVKWIQSFADERCGGFGIVYQACSFSYFGEHIATFYTDGKRFFHNIQVTASRNKAGTQVKNKEDLDKVELRQFRYIKFIDYRWKKKCLLKEKPYPKHYKKP